MVTLPELRREASALNQDRFFHSMRLSDAIGYSLYAQKVAASVLTAIGVLCLLLAVLGLYSVMSYSVSQRTQEFGIRMALGASQLSVLVMVTRQSLILAIPGLLVGIPCALIGFRFLSGMLIGVGPTDPLTFLAAALVQLVVTLFASYLPARRAVQVDPVTALRCQ
jgi:ABC-type antimicrobial peptide transport system permease subunit